MRDYLSSNKKTVLQKMRDLGIDEAVCEFNGEGDEGWVQTPRDKKLDNQTVQILYETHKYDPNTKAYEYSTEAKDVSLAKAIQTVAECYLEDASPGWEINEGSEGSVVLDSKKFLVLVRSRRREVRFLDEEETEY